MGRENTLLREIAQRLDGELTADAVALPRRGCTLRLRIAAWRTDDDEVVREWSVCLRSTRDEPPPQGGAPCVSTRATNTCSG